MYVCCRCNIPANVAAFCSVSFHVETELTHPQQWFIYSESRFPNDFPDCCDKRSALRNHKHSQAKGQTAVTEVKLCRITPNLIIKQSQSRNHPVWNVIKWLRQVLMIMKWSYSSFLTLDVSLCLSCAGFSCALQNFNNNINSLMENRLYMPIPKIILQIH